MYVIYETAQYDFSSIREEFIKYYQPIKKVPSNLPKPEFIPTKLVRISDMTIVDGSQVDEGYCALSYSWNQSGEILHDEATGKYKRIDEGKHEIVTYENMFPDMIIPYNETIFNDKLKKMYEVLQIMDKNNYFFMKTTKYAKFENIIQQICLQFNIKYIWYDQMCINQDDKEEKYREIRNMHHIYGNAHCTAALVPDYTYSSPFLGENGEEYFKRLWTLEEAIKSERLLFVGRDVHEWGEDLSSIYEDTNIFDKPLSKISVSQILHQAHRRTSTKAHDRVFALIHLFPEFMEHINIDYNQPLEDLMIRFYGLLAKKDISILLFGDTSGYDSTIQKFKFLPSWTGINGIHLIDEVIISFRNYDIIGKTMQVTSEFVTNDESIDDNPFNMRKEDLPSYPSRHMNDDDYQNYIYYLCIAVQLPGTTGEQRSFILWSIDNYNDIFEIDEHFDKISEELKRLSRFMEIKKEALYWCRWLGRNGIPMGVALPYLSLTEDVDNPDTQYIILSEISFKLINFNFCYPVIKKKQGEEYYKVIGFFVTSWSKEDIFFDCNLPKQTFSIQ